MSKKISNQDIADYLLNRLNPYRQNVFLNVSRDTQKKVLEGVKQELKDDFFDKRFGVLHLDGSELMKETSVIRTAIKDWCIQKAFKYDDIESEYIKLQEANVDKISAAQLNEFQRELRTMEKSRDKNLQCRSIARVMYNSYFGSKLYHQMLSVYPNVLTSQLYLLPTDEKKEKIIKQYQAILNGDIDEYLLNFDFDISNLKNICDEVFRTDRHGFLTLIRNGESIVDYDLQTVINAIMATRSAALSVSLMSRANAMYTYYVTDGFSLEEIHDISTQDVKLIKKYF